MRECSIIPAVYPSQPEKPQREGQNAASAKKAMCTQHIQYIWMSMHAHAVYVCIHRYIYGQTDIVLGIYLHTCDRSNSSNRSNSLVKPVYFGWPSLPVH